MDLELKGRRRFTSVKRARDPYDAEGRKGRCQSPNSPCRHSEKVEQLPRLSAAITTPSLNLTARTEVPVTMGDFVWV